MALLRSRRRLIVALLAVLATAAASAAGWFYRDRLGWTDATTRAGRAELADRDPQPPLLDPESTIVAPDSIEALAPDAARSANAQIPFSTLPILAAPPFFEPSTDLVVYARALDCMTAAIYYEAGAETTEGQLAVAQVILNRMRHPAYPKSICGVVFEGSERSTGCQFTFTCAGAMARLPWLPAWERARVAAGMALNGRVSRAVGMATHYHTDWVFPFWAPRLVKVAQIGTHIFYRWPGGWGLPGAFSGRYAGAEAEVQKMTVLGAIRAEPTSDTVPVDLPPMVLPELAPGELVASLPEVGPVAPVEIRPPVVPDVETRSLASPPAPRAPPVITNPLAPPTDTGRDARQRRIPLPTTPPL